MTSSTGTLEATRHPLARAARISIVALAFGAYPDRQRM